MIFFWFLMALYSTLHADPTIFAIAGPPAAGKSTFIQEKIRENFFPEDIFIHDCDAVMNSLEGYQLDLKTVGSALAFQKWELPAREIAESMLTEAVQARKNIIYDRSCALPASYIFLQDIVEKYDYTLVMHILHVSKQEALSRAEKREKTTGRHIPKNVILERMAGIKELWPSYAKLAKFSYLYDSNNKSYHLIAMTKNYEITIHNKKSYEAYLNDDSL
jgi:predicted kinase